MFGCLQFPSFACTKNFKPWQFKGTNNLLPTWSSTCEPIRSHCMEQGLKEIVEYVSLQVDGVTSRSTSTKRKIGDKCETKWKVEGEKWRWCCCCWPPCNDAESPHSRPFSSIHTHKDSSRSSYCLSLRFLGKWHGPFLYILYGQILCSDAQSHLPTRRFWCYSGYILPVASGI